VVSYDNIHIDHTVGQDFEVYDSETIDKFLSDIDQHVDYMLPSCHGPFSAFMTTQNKPDQVVTPTTSHGLTSQGIEPVEAYSSSAIGFLQPRDPVLHEEGLQKDDSRLAPNSTIWLPSNVDTSLHFSCPAEIDDLFDNNSIEDSSPNEYGIEISPVSWQNAVGEEDAPSSETSLVSHGGNSIIVRQFDNVLSGSRQQDYLIKHYYDHVAAVLLPLNYSDNPFRSIYLSTAMEGLFRYNSHATTSREVACTALYQSLLASAAYHRWQCNKQEMIYHELGAKYRINSIQLLQVALAQAPPTANYQALMLAVLSLVTIGVSQTCSYHSWSLLT
jgi:hypothetical protein